MLVMNCMYCCRQRCAMQNPATARVHVQHTMASRLSHITNRLQQSHIVPQRQTPGTRTQLKTKQYPILLVFLMLFVIVLPYAVLVLCIKATSQQSLRLHMGATDSAIKLIAHITQQNQALQPKSWQKQ